jgi:hypothetical protein
VLRKAISSNKTDAGQWLIISRTHLAPKIPGLYRNGLPASGYANNDAVAMPNRDTSWFNASKKSDRRVETSFKEE